MKYLLFLLIFGHRTPDSIVYSYGKTGRTFMEEIARYYKAEVQFQTSFDKPCDRIFGWGGINLEGIRPGRLASHLSCDKVSVTYQSGTFYCRELEPVSLQ